MKIIEDCKKIMMPPKKNMPLKAIVAETKEPVYSYAFASKIALLAKHDIGSLRCPITDLEVFPRGGRLGLVLHFVRKGKAQQVSLDHHPESYEHNLLKLNVLNALQEEITKDPSLSGWTVEPEYKLPSVGKNGRIADLAVISSTGKCIYVYECQLSSITEQELEQRTNDYEEFGIDCMWIFGKSANNIQNQRWCYERIGITYTARFSANQVSELGFLESPYNYREEAV